MISIDVEFGSSFSNANLCLEFSGWNRPSGLHSKKTNLNDLVARRSPQAPVPVQQAAASLITPTGARFACPERGYAAKLGLVRSPTVTTGDRLIQRRRARNASNGFGSYWHRAECSEDCLCVNLLRGRHGLQRLLNGWAVSSVDLLISNLMKFG
jgi:hypothetical protein